MLTKEGSKFYLFSCALNKKLRTLVFEACWKFQKPKNQTHDGIKYSYSKSNWMNSTIFKENWWAGIKV